MLRAGAAAEGGLKPRRQSLPSRATESPPQEHLKAVAQVLWLLRLL
jgi:hypothetical protein